MAIPQVLAWFHQFKQPEIPEEVWLKCQLALIEGFTNVVRHAHRNLPAETAIELEVKVLHQCIEIRIWDSGTGFDLQSKLNHLTHTLSPQSEGGRGLLLMHKIADCLSYCRTPDERNCLLMIKEY